MIKSPFFSIIIPTYNRAQTLRFTLFCLLLQNFSDFEIVISDNCSNDTTKDVIMSFGDKRIKYYRMKRMTPYVQNLKNAMRHAKGQYIFLHSDDDFLLYNDALLSIAKKISDIRIGYMRINYMCLSSNKKHLFHFKFHNPFRGEAAIPRNMNNKKIIDFIINSDHFFISGIIFKRTFTKKLTLINSEHAPWIGLLFEAVKQLGGYFFQEPLIVANWSVWRNKKNGKHPVYSLTKGKLEFENYLAVVKAKYDPINYQQFLHEQLMVCYVIVLPVIKVLVGNTQMCQLAQRINAIDSRMKRSLTYWAYFIFAIVVPANIIKFVKDRYLDIYMRRTEIDHKEKVIKRLHQLEKEYSVFQQIELFNE